MSTRFPAGSDEALVIEQIRANAAYWGSDRCKRDTMEKYAAEKGVKNPSAVVDRLIREGVVVALKRGYVALKPGVPKRPEKSEKKPTLKELMTGRVLNGYIEATRARTLNEFFTVDASKEEARSKYDALTVKAKIVDRMGRFPFGFQAPPGSVQVNDDRWTLFSLNGFTSKEAAVDKTNAMPELREKNCVVVPWRKPGNLSSTWYVYWK